VIERRFDAPAHLVWRMWTEPDHFKAWFGPTGVTIPVAKMDVHVGGRRLICMEMSTPEGARRMWFSGEYLEIVENVRLVYTESMSDESGEPIASHADSHPVRTVVTVELAESAGRTTMMLTHAGIPADSAGAAGWRMALDKLTDHVASQLD
jgi:uncharacterized protein YndB with AHSA1/START domain